jgi:outer membrane protein assembly factor BamB
MNNITIKTVAGIAIIVLCLSVKLLGQTSGNWPQWRGPNRDGKVTNVALPQTWPKTLKEEWTVPVGIGHSSPVVADGRIYVFARQDEQEVLLCLDLNTGKEIWRSAQPVTYQMHPAAVGHGKGPKATPVVSNGNVYTFGISGILSCHDARTGKLKWREFARQYPNTSPLFGTAMSPVVDNGVLIAHLGGHDKGALTAFDAETGKIKWSNDTDGPAYSSPLVVTLAGVRQVVTFTQKEFVGVDLASGKLLWHLPAKSQYEENSVTTVSYKDMLIFSREGMGLTAIRLEKQDGQLVPKEIWSNKDQQLYLNSPVLNGTTLFGLSALKKGQFFAIDADTGKTLWLGPGRMGENAAILNLDSKAMLLLTNDATLTLLPVDAKEYSPLIQYTVAKSPTWAHPLVMGRRILIKDQNSLISLTF